MDSDEESSSGPSLIKLKLIENREIRQQCLEDDWIWQIRLNPDFKEWVNRISSKNLTTLRIYFLNSSVEMVKEITTTSECKKS